MACIQKTERFILRVATEELNDWKEQAAALGVSVAELVRLRMQRRHGPEPVVVEPKPSPPAALAKLARHPTIAPTVVPARVADPPKVARMLFGNPVLEDAVPRAIEGQAHGYNPKPTKGKRA